MVPDQNKNKRCRSQKAVVPKPSLTEKPEVTLAEKVNLMMNGEYTHTFLDGQLKNTKDDPHMNCLLRNFQFSFSNDSDTDETTLYPLGDVFNNLEDLDLFESPILEDLETTQEYLTENPLRLSSDTAAPKDITETATTPVPQLSVEQTCIIEVPATQSETENTPPALVSNDVVVSLQKNEEDKHVNNSETTQEKGDNVQQADLKETYDLKESASHLFAKIMETMADSITDPMAREMAKIECQQVMLKHRFSGRIPSNTA